MNIDANDPRQPYMQVAEALQAAITSGEMQPGEQLPSIRELADRHGVAPATIQRSLDVLRRRGVIVSWQGRGSFVREPDSSTTSAPQDAPTFDEVMRHLGQIQDHLRRLDERVTEIEKDARKAR